MARFKSKKKGSNWLIYFGLFLISVAFSIKYLYSQDLKNNNTIVINLLNDNLGIYKNNNIGDVDFLLKYALNIDYKENNLVFENEKDDDKNLEVPVSKEENDIKEELIPLVYVYNSHQDEKYQSTNLEPYNISFTVYMASQILKEYLEDLGIGVVVEDRKVADTLHSLNLKYSNSYKVSRMFMESASKDNPTLKYFIDLHRDSSKYESTTTKIDEESYAKVLFVVGLENPNYEPNLALAENLKKKIVGFNENLFRGIMKKSGSGVNGVYNQDFSPNTVLIEVGGQYNNISEVNNTLKVLASIIESYIKDDLNGKKEKS